MLCLVIGLVFLASGCSGGKISQEKIKEIKYTVEDNRKLPEMLTQKIEKEKEKPMKIVWGDAESTYIVRGYGERDTKGCRVEVEEVYEGKEVIVVRTRLYGPHSKAEAEEGERCPYVAVKISHSEKRVVFEE